MLKISRTKTPFPESWLSESDKIARNSGRYSMVKVQPSRFSVTTINSELFPELLSWSAMMNAQSSSPRSQIVPSDVSKPTESEFNAVGIALSLSAIFDPTTLDFGFDHTIFGGLDDLVVYSPMDAFSETCWSAATESSAESPSDSFRKRNSSGSARTPQLPIPTRFSSDSDTDSDEYQTLADEEALLCRPTCYTASRVQISVGEQPPYNKVKGIYFDDDKTSFMVFEPKFPVANPKDSINFFPVPTPKVQKGSSRIATFRAHLPSGLRP